MFLDFFHSSATPKSCLVSKILGCFLLMLAVMVGMFFLFQALVPQIGFLESGAVVSTFLTLAGIVLLFVGRKKEAHSLTRSKEQAIDMYKHVDVDSFLKNNSFKFALLSFGVGLLLSQLKKPHELEELLQYLKFLK